MRGEDSPAGFAKALGNGSPPHARGRLPVGIPLRRRSRDHPRMRGEDRDDRTRVRLEGGSPPHARGRPKSSSACWTWTGITPACAGKTSSIAFLSSVNRDHPRMRGEDSVFAWRASWLMGSPPHARGRPGAVSSFFLEFGITPACAGKTARWSTARQMRRDHPRMRGEDATSALSRARSAGSPPHARGRRVREMSRSETVRITPACAGKTRSLICPCCPLSDHPRMRGEDSNRPWPRTPQRGSPPHARGRLGFHCTQTTSSVDHPRMRGEDFGVA